MWDGGIPWISGASMQGIRLSASERTVSVSALGNGTTLAKAGSTLILVRGMGIINELRLGHAVRDVAFNQDVKALRPRPSISSWFLTYALASQWPSIREMIHLAGHGTGILPTDRLLRLELSLPPLAEQRRIAGVLSGVDDLIESLDDLIAKKRAVKAAAMDDLLTGRRRLPGFDTGAGTQQTEIGDIPADWEVRTLGDVSTRSQSGGTPSRGVAAYWNGDLPWATVKDFETFDPFRTQERITLEGLKRSSAALVPAGTLIVGMRMSIGRTSIYRVPVAINQDLRAVYLEPVAEPEFVREWLAVVRPFLLASSGGSTVAGLTSADLMTVLIPLPAVPEQRRIAEVLSAMDDEIEALSARREKAVAVKAALMDELLTGRTRLL